jgi:hypothetical protein
MAMFIGPQDAGENNQKNQSQDRLSTPFTGTITTTVYLKERNF